MKAYCQFQREWQGPKNSKDMLIISVILMVIFLKITF